MSHQTGPATATATTGGPPSLAPLIDDLWPYLAPVLREARALWYDAAGDPIVFLPSACFSYHVPVLTPDDDPVEAELHRFFRLRHGDAFLPLLRAVQGLQIALDSYWELRARLDESGGDEGEDGDGPPD